MNLERRQYGRVTPVERIRGTVGTVIVYVVDLSLSGLRVAHQDPLPKMGELCTLQFQWQGRRVTMRCEVRRTEVAKAARTLLEKTLHHTGLAIISRDEVADATIREIIEAAVTRALDEQKANAMGIPAIAAQSFQTGKSEELLRCELGPRGWTKTKTSDRTQPRNGFTVSCDEEPAKIDMLCRAYESGDAEGRKLIRTFAGLSISRSEGIPTRRYAP
ncbi:MAG TPA: PilZ domain-containing protein [Thermoanaerobaculia bacterium]|nr:PilZ domain-containing protein [Thermoanaerobaculia bacterium]